MVAVAQGISKQTNIVKQSALGTAGSSGSQTRRRITSVWSAPRDTFENNEIATHQQSTGVTLGIKKPTGKMTGILSPSTYKLEMAALLRKDFASGATTGALTNVTAATTSGAQGTFTRASGSYFTDGFKQFDIIRWTGWAGGSAANNNTKNVLIIMLTATVMTVTTFDGTAIVADAAGDSVTATVVGKKTYAPTTGHTNDYFSVEEWYGDLTDADFFTDAKPAKMQLSLPASGNAGIDIDWVALGRTLSGTQTMTSPTAATTTSALTAAVGVVWIQTSMATGVLYPITGATITIDGSTVLGDAEVGSNSLSDVSRGRVKVDGQFTGLLKDQVLSGYYEAGTAISIALIALDTTAATSSFVTFVIPRVKITNDPPDDGEKQIVRTYSFTAELNGSGGSGTNAEQTIISIQDSDA